MKEKYYITTAIAYASAKPHIGNTYEIVLADAIARHKRLRDLMFIFKLVLMNMAKKLNKRLKMQIYHPKNMLIIFPGK